MRKLSALLRLQCSVLLVFVCWARAATATKPNIMVIMVDDMGYSDMGCFGGEVNTPNLNSLAENGVRFTQFYNMARCSPTRASVMTGQYPHKVNMGSNGNSLGRTGITMGEALGGANGYNTAMVGKWHLSALPSDPSDCSGRLEWLNHQCGLGATFASDISTYPINRGFDRHYGLIWGVANYFDPFSLVDGETSITNAPQDWADSHDGEDYYITDDLTEKATDYINELAQDDKPFIMYLQYTAPHWPLHARPEDIEKYQGVYDAGYEAIREARYERMTSELGLLDAATTPLPASQYNTWDSLSASDKAMQSAKMSVHAAMIDRVDQGIGQIISTLQANDIFDNTLILFFSDNGCSPEEYLASGYDRPSETRDGQTIRYSGYTAEECGSETTFPYLSYSWANVANTPMRYWKKESYEGGCCTPMIAHWPQGISVPAGSIISDMGHVIDVLPTCLDVAGVEYPSTYNGYTLTSLDGKSLLPLFQGQGRPDYKELYFEHESGKAVRIENWKMSQYSGNNDWELFNIDVDRTETNDVESQYPEIYQGLLNKWNKWGVSVGISAAVSGPYENNAEYDFEGGLDDSRAFNDGKYISYDDSSAVYAAGENGQGIVFDGNGAVQIDNEISKDFTISFWVKSDAEAAGEAKFFQGMGLICGEVAGPVNKFGLSLTDGGKVYFGMAATDVPAEHINSQITINDGQWHHVAAVHDADLGDGLNGSISLFVDGHLKDTASGTVYYGTKYASETLLIGAVSDEGDSLYGGLVGMMDDVTLFCSVLSNEEILALAAIVDNDAPTPNPAEFAVVPVAVDSSSVTMTAVDGSDAYPPIEYYFDETSENLGGTDSGWQESATYVDSGLKAGTQYSYLVKMRDAAGNETAASAAMPVWTIGGPDLDDSGIVDVGDIAKLAEGWLLGNCLVSELCGGLDISVSNIVDMSDVAIIANAWLTEISNDPITFFSDSYDRSQNNDIDADSTGMSGELAPMTYVESFEGSGTTSSIQVNNSRLQVATGAGMSNLYLDHNFIDSTIWDRGGLVIKMDVSAITSSTSDITNRFGGFGVGMTASEAAAAGDISDNTTTYRGGGTATGVCDLFVDISMDGYLRVWKNGTVATSYDISAASGTITVLFTGTSFNAGSSVTANIYYNGSKLGAETFSWDNSNSNYIGISGRASTSVAMDNLLIRTLF